MRNRLTMLAALGCGAVWADNPLVTHIYTADPTARVFNDVLYVYPSHDINEQNGLSGKNGFMMRDYHVFSTTDLINYTDHGVILDQEDVDWVDNNSFAMWAPDCIEKGGKFYFYFPGNFKVGVAVSDSPTGPFVPHQKPIEHANGIDPGIFIDDDGTPYLYFGGGKETHSLKGMRMKADMITPDMQPVSLNLPEKYKEGSFMFKRGGLYYFTFPHDTKGSEDIAYAVGKSPLGPFEYKGVILDRWTDNCWTIHHSVVQYKGQWYLFYHHHDLTKDGTLRSMCADKLEFNDDGTIRKVIPTRRGIGIRQAKDVIQVDRFSESSGLNTPAFGMNEYGGFYLSGIKEGSWLRYGDVDFGENRFPSVSARIFANGRSGSIELRVGHKDGLKLATIPVPADTGLKWTVVTAPVEMTAKGIEDLVLVFRTLGEESDPYFVDWVRFNTPETVQVCFSGNGCGKVLINGSQEIPSHNVNALIDSAKWRESVTAVPGKGSHFTGFEQNGNPVGKITKINSGDRICAAFKQDYPNLNILEKLEAEQFTYNGGVLAIDGVEGARGIGHIKNGSSVLFKNVDFGDGAVGFSARAAALAGGKIEIHLDNSGGTPAGLLGVGGAGGRGPWEIYKMNGQFPGGVHDVYLKFSGEPDSALFEINWFKFLPVFRGNRQINAADYSEQSGINTEPCSEGGRNVGYIENGDSITFRNVVFDQPAAKISARVACGTSGGKITVEISGVSAGLAVKPTGGWQNWETVSSPVSVPKGTHDITVKFSGGTGYLFNLNWLQFE